jgi:hypothetical protein
MAKNYYHFRKFLDMIEEDFDIVDADMDDYAHDMVIKGDSPNGTITVTVELKEKKEEQKNAD